MKKFLKAAAAFAAMSLTMTAIALVVAPAAPLATGVVTAAIWWVLN